MFHYQFESDVLLINQFWIDFFGDEFSVPIDLFRKVNILNRSFTILPHNSVGFIKLANSCWCVSGTDFCLISHLLSALNTF